MRFALMILAMTLAGCGAYNPAEPDVPAEGVGSSGAIAPGAQLAASASTTGALVGAVGGGAGTSDGSAAGGSGSSTSGSNGGSGASGGGYVDTWATFAQEFFANNCEHCHGWATSYDYVAANASSIRTAIAKGFMPADHALGSSDQQRVLAWLDCGEPH